MEASGISNDIWGEIADEISEKDTIQITSGKRERRIRITDEWKEEVRAHVYGRLTFLMVLFQYLAQQANGQPEVEGFGPEHEEEQLILDLIDTKAIASKYPDALAFFQEHLWHSSFQASVKIDRITRLRAGSFILLKGPRSGAELVVISWQKEPLQALLTFLTKLGKISNIELLPVFSPEEEAFAPYFDLLGMVQKHLIQQEHLRPVISKAITNFSESNFTDCVSSIGLAAEDVLTQIFETLFREQLVKGLTLGQLVDEIHSRSAQLFSKKEEPPPDMSSLFTEIKAVIDTDSTDQKKTLELMRRFLAQVIEANKYVLTKVDKIGRIERKMSVFSEKVGYMLTELIRFRNAASHRSRVPIGPYECRRSAYAFVVLYTWWGREKKLIDWSKAPRDILLDCVHRNASH